jgi:ferredoxin
VWERVGGRESVYMYACVRVCPESCLAIIRDSPFAGDRS